jgi:hypothetical protein
LSRTAGIGCAFICDRATVGKQLEKKFCADNTTGRCSKWSADQETAHTRIIAVAAIAFDVRAEKSAGDKPADAADDTATTRAVDRA